MATWVLPAAAAPADSGAPPSLIYPTPEGYRRPRGPFLVASAVALALLMGLALRMLLTGGHLRDAGVIAENRSQTRTDHEELVKRFILGRYGDEKAPKIEFLTWGPHMSKQEWLDLLDEAGLREELKRDRWHQDDLSEMEALDAVIRVCYRLPEGETKDQLFLVKGKIVQHHYHSRLPSRAPSPRTQGPSRPPLPSEPNSLPRPPRRCKTWTPKRTSASSAEPRMSM
jgi:hypothetical protein